MKKNHSIKNLSILILLILLSSIVSAQKIYRLNFLETYNGGKMVSSGNIDGDTLIIDETDKKILIIPSKPEYKTQIFKIINKDCQGDETRFHCQMKNSYGIVDIDLILDTFYKSLKCIGWEERKENNFIIYYFK